jgi:hypothetical protein
MIQTRTGINQALLLGVRYVFVFLSFQTGEHLWHHAHQTFSVAILYKVLPQKPCPIVKVMFNVALKFHLLQRFLCVMTVAFVTAQALMIYCADMHMLLKFALVCFSVSCSSTFLGLVGLYPYTEMDQKFREECMSRFRAFKSS